MEKQPLETTEPKVHSFVTDRIRQTRVRKHFSQEYVAKKLGLTQKAYSKIETNETRMNVDTLLRISEILETSVHEFISDSKTPVVNDFSSGREGDNVMYKTENESIIQRLLELLLQTKDEVIAGKQRQIDLLQEKIKAMETAPIRIDH